MKKVSLLLSLLFVLSLFVLVDRTNAVGGAAKTNVPVKLDDSEVTQQQAPKVQATGMKEVTGQPVQKREELGEMRGEIVREREELRDASQSAKENMSNVASKVGSLLEMKDDKKGIGQKVKEVAKEQIQSQEKIAEKLAKMEEKKIWLKKMFGYDKEAVQSVQQEIEANRLRIEELQTLRDQTTDKTELAALEEAISSLVEQNSSLQDTVRTEMQNQGVWGWFRGLINRS